MLIQLLWRLTVSSIISIFLCSCNNANVTPLIEQGKVPPVTFRLRVNERQALLSRAQQLSLGMSASEVLGLLGKPTYDAIVGPKVTTKDNEDKFRRSLRYILVEHGHGGNSEDESLEVILDRRGLGVLNVTFINVDEISGGAFTCSRSGNVRVCTLKGK
jgi:hypothetical protein